MKKQLEHPAHDDVQPRLRRIAGQIQGVQRMIEQRKYCCDILTQIQAARSALRAVVLKFLEKHMTHCVNSALVSQSPADATEKVAELLEILKRRC